MSNGQIPVLSVTAGHLPHAWEKAVLAVHTHGSQVGTQYDKPGDLPSLDATVSVHVQRPLAEPRLHLNIPGGPMELEVYRQEVVGGIHDHWIAPEEGKWTYTYHKRLFSYGISGLMNVPTTVSENGLAVVDSLEVNQIEYMVDSLAKCPFTRRAQAITWMPTCDPPTDDPPCLQRLWARMLRDERGVFRLDMNSYWRSRDLWKAWFMNAYAIIDLQARMAVELEKRLGVPVRVGRYVDTSDSLHIYGSYRDDKLDAEIKKMKQSSWRSRAANTSVFQPMFDETAAHLAEDTDYYANGGK